MKKLKSILCYTLLIGLLAGCHQKNKDAEYFNGEIKYFNTDRKIVKEVSSKDVSLNGLNYGLIAVYDSLLICWNTKLPGYFFNIFNVDTGEEIGHFCPRGQGSGEAASLSPLFQFIKKGNDITTLLLDNKEQLFAWNISRSIQQKTTVWDTIVPFTKKGDLFSRDYDILFSQSEDTLFAYAQSDYISDYNSNIVEVTTPVYEKRILYTNELLQEYPIYKKKTAQRPNTKKTMNFLGSFFYTWDVIKPDGSKIVQAMRSLPQINIINTHTGKVAGYRMENGADFSMVETGMSLENVYYNGIHADDNFIYAAYWGKEPWWGRAGVDDEMPELNTIHVFDWDGNLLHELRTDRAFFAVWSDPVRNRLYTQNPYTDEVYYIDLHELKI